MDINVAFISLGCDKNLVDSEVMLGLLSRHGYEFTDDEEEAEAVDFPEYNTTIYGLSYWHREIHDRLYDELRGIETRIESFFYVLFYKDLGHSEIVNHDDPAFVKLVYHLH